MSSDSHSQLVKRQAWGTTMAATPPMKEMQERVAGWFAAGVPEDEIRRRLCAEAVVGEFGLRPFLGLNRKAMRLKAADAVVYLATQYTKKLGSKRLGQVLGDWAHQLGVDSWLADWQIAWYRTGSPPPISEHVLGGVTKIMLGPAGDQSPMVVAMAGALSDPEAMAEDFINRCYREFPQAFARKEHAMRDAERMRRFEAGETDFQIAKAELEVDEWSQRAVNKREYNLVVRTRANAITQARKRWLAYVTQAVETVSPKSG